MSKHDNPYRTPTVESVAPAADTARRTPAQVIAASVFVGAWNGAFAGVVALILMFASMMLWLWFGQPENGLVGIRATVENLIVIVLAIAFVGALAGTCTGIAVGLLLGAAALGRSLDFAARLRIVSLVLWGFAAIAWVGVFVWFAAGGPLDRPALAVVPLFSLIIPAVFAGFRHARSIAAFALQS